MSQETYSDNQILQLILKGGKDKEDAAIYLFDSMQGFIITIQGKLNLSLEDARDAYSDALVKLVRQIKNQTFRGDSKVSSYFYSIFYNTAVDVSRKKTTNKNIKTLPLEDYDVRERDLLGLMDKKEEAKRLVHVMGELGPACKKILLDWGYYGYNMQEIADRSQLSNADSARSMKYKCLKKLKTLLANKMFDHE